MPIDRDSDDSDGSQVTSDSDIDELQSTIASTPLPSRNFSELPPSAIKPPPLKRKPGRPRANAPLPASGNSIELAGVINQNGERVDTGMKAVATIKATWTARPNETVVWEHRKVTDMVRLGIL